MKKSTRMTLTLVVLCAATAYGQTEAPPALPATDVLFDRYVEAVGGVDAMQDKKFLHSTGTFTLVGMGVTGTLESHRAAPNLQYDRIEIEGLGLQEQGYDGQVAWERSTMLGPTILDGLQGELAALDAEFFPELYFDRLYETLTTVAEVEFAGHTCYEVLAVTASDHERRLYFDTQTSLLVGLVENRPTEMGSLDVKVTLGNYEAFEDVRVATFMEMSVFGQVQRVEIESVSFEPDDSVSFALPDDVKVLLGEG